MGKSVCGPDCGNWQYGDCSLGQEPDTCGYRNNPTPLATPSGEEAEPSGQEYAQFVYNTRREVWQALSRKHHQEP